MTAVKLTIHTSEKNSARICRLKGLVGSKKEVKLYIDAFKIKSEVMMRELPFHM
jgi:hypothetical protein